MEKRWVLELTLTLGDAPDFFIPPEYKAEAARLLRHAADRIERDGHDCGGFHLSAEDSHGGGYVIHRENKPVRPPEIQAVETETA